MPNSELDGPVTYQITVLGHLDESWSTWLNGLTITNDSGCDDMPTSTLTGPVADQSSLRGLLSKVWDLNLILISLNRIRRNTNRADHDDD